MNRCQKNVLGTWHTSSSRSRGHYPHPAPRSLSAKTLRPTGPHYSGNGKAGSTLHPVRRAEPALRPSGASPMRMGFRIPRTVRPRWPWSHHVDARSATHRGPASRVVSRQPTTWPAGSAFGLYLDARWRNRRGLRTVEPRPAAPRRAADRYPQPFPVGPQQRQVLLFNGRIGTLCLGRLNLLLSGSLQRS